MTTDICSFLFSSSSLHLSDSCLDSEMVIDGYIENEISTTQNIFCYPIQNVIGMTFALIQTGAKRS